MSKDMLIKNALLWPAADRDVIENKD